MKVIWLNLAINDLEDIALSLSQHSIQGTIRVITQIQKQSMLLEEFPYIGTQTKYENIRVIIIPETKFIVFYRVSPDFIEIFPHSQTKLATRRI